MVTVPIIIDIVGSRLARDRAALHSQVHEIFARVEAAVPSHTALWATVGDEFQVVYDSLENALGATALVRLLSTGELDLRFGIGIGDIRTIATGPSGPIDDGPGWYHARQALEELSKLQGHGHPWLRTWVVTDGEHHLLQPLTRALLTSRDHTISRMKAKEKRMTAQWHLGATQKDIARLEKMSQAAVSQRLEVSGGAAIMQMTNLLTSEAS